MTAPSPSPGLFARLPVGRSASVRVLLITSALVTAACLFWIQQLGNDTHGLALSFFTLFSLFDSSAAMVALGILVVALFVPPMEALNRLLQRIGEHPCIVGGVIAVLFSIGTLLIYHNHPLSMDEYAVVFQSQVFAAGRLAGQFPVDLLDFLVPKVFQNYFLTTSQTTGAVASKYWPSFALLLTPFSRLGIPWACNAVLSGATLIVLNRLSKRLFGSSEAAGLVMLLTIASPVFFADGISYYSMTAHMLANALFTLLVLQPTSGRLFVAGVVGSIALTLHNPVPHALFALPWFLWLATREKPLAKLIPLCAGYLPLSLLLGVGWFWYSGQLAHGGGPATDGVGSLNDVAAAFGWPNGTVLYARLVGLAKILLWAAPCVMLLALAGAWRQRFDSRLLTLAASGLLTLLGFLFVPADQGHGWGFRYFHSAWFVLPVLATAFLFSPPTEARNANPAAADIRTYVVACALISVFAGVGLRASQMNDFITNQLNQYPHYAGGEPRVVVKSNLGFYPYDLVQNDPFLRNDVVRVVDLGGDETSAAIQKHFPTYHRVYADQYGEVWSAAPTHAAAARH